MPYSYEYATDNGILCPHCHLKPFSSNPRTGGDFCEGAGCVDAWVRYLESGIEVGKLCDICKNRGWETMAKVAACNCCENYEFYIPEDGWEEDE